MREILFRGKSTDGEWVEGYYFKGWHWQEKREVNAIIPLNAEVFGWSDLSDCIDVVPETVGQYTGLTDNHGKKIFEGDIVDFEYGQLKKRGYVFYHDSGAKFGVKEADYDNLSILHVIHVKEWNMRVIGNIHDNPELLKGGAE